VPERIDLKVGANKRVGRSLRQWRRDDGRAFRHPFRVVIERLIVIEGAGRFRFQQRVETSLQTPRKVSGGVRRNLTRAGLDQRRVALHFAHTGDVPRGARHDERGNRQHQREGRAALPELHGLPQA
jgi:hypothetical protein